MGAWAAGKVRAARSACTRAAAAGLSGLAGLGVRLLPLWHYRRQLLAALGIGAAAGVAPYFAGPWLASLLSGLSCDERLLPWPRTPGKVRAMLADYYRYVSYLDSQIGRVLDALEASPFAKNTIVVFSADSGVARGSHGLIGKQNLDEHSLRVPLIVTGPGIPAGKTTDAMCYLFDMLPTLGKLCGVPAPAGSEGIDLTATRRDPSKAARSRLLFAYKDVQRAILDGRWKLIRYPQVDRTQLFDLQADPHEATNLADRPEQAARLAKLTALLKEEMERSGDTAPLKVAHPKPADWKPPADEKPTEKSKSSPARS